MNAQRSTDDAQCEGELQFSYEIAAVASPHGQWLIATAARGVGVCTSFDRTKIVAGGQYYRVHAIHDAFVVGRCAIRVDLGETRGFDDAVDDIGAFEVRGRWARTVAGAALAEQEFTLVHAAGGAHAPTVTQVREYPEPQPATAELGGAWPYGFCHGVDQVCAHGILAVHQ